MRAGKVAGTRGALNPLTPGLRSVLCAASPTSGSMPLHSIRPLERTTRHDILPLRSGAARAAAAERRRQRSLQRTLQQSLQRSYRRRLRNVEERAPIGLRQRIGALLDGVLLHSTARQGAAQ